MNKKQRGTRVEDVVQWKKFEFFEEKSGRFSIHSDVEGNLQCCSSGRGRIALGCDDGMVHFLDRGFKPASSFRAHAANVLFIQHLKQRSVLFTVGEDETTSPQLASICLKAFDLDKMEIGSSSTTSPFCIQILRIFTNQFPEAKGWIMVVSTAASKVTLHVSIITRIKLQVETGPNVTQSPVTGLAFRVDGTALCSDPDLCESV